MAHKTEHDRFTANVMGLLERFEQGADINDEVLDLVKDWLAHHILHVDKAYARILVDKGVT